MRAEGVQLAGKGGDQPIGGLRVCIVSPGEVGLTETFIRAHIECLPFEVLCLHGYWQDYTWNGRKLRERYEELHRGRGRWLNVLPRFLEFRLRLRYYPTASDAQIASKFMREQQVDVVLAEYGTAAAFIAPMCQTLGIPLIAHFHGFDASRSGTLEEFSDGYRRMFEYAAAVISVSRAMSAELIALGCPESKIILNPYGPHPSYFDVQANYASDTLIAVGRLTAKKAPYLTLDAFRLAHAMRPELRLCMIGGGEVSEVCERLARAWGLEKCVEFVGPAGVDVIQTKMQQAFAFVQHSVTASDGNAEGLPVAILEAGAAGLPVIATRHAGIPDAVIPGATGFLVEPGNSQEMAAGMLELAANRDLAQAMGAAAKQRIRNHFSMERHLKVLSEILLAAACVVT